MPIRGSRAEYNAYLNDYMKRRWKTRREIAVRFLGGKCDCGSPEDLDFHHIDRKSKINSIAKMSSASEEKFWAEIKKCVLRCKPCHKKEHKGP